MFLLDTSVWIAIFDRKHPLQIEETVAFDEIVTCLPVIQEVLQGFRDEAAFRLARESLFSLPHVGSPILEDLILEAVDLYRAARRGGVSIRSGVDCLIAAIAIRHDLTVLHRDRDFSALSAFSAIRERSV